MQYHVTQNRPAPRRPVAVAKAANFTPALTAFAVSGIIIFFASLALRGLL